MGIRSVWDKIKEIASRPKEVLTPGYDPTPGISPGQTYGDPSEVPVSLGGTAPTRTYRSSGSTGTAGGTVGGGGGTTSPIDTSGRLVESGEPAPILTKIQATTPIREEITAPQRTGLVQDLTISKAQPIIEEEKAEARRLRFTHQEGFFDFVGETYRETALPEIVGGFKSLLGFGKREDYQREAFELAPVSQDYPTRETISFAEKLDVDLSEPALIYRKEIKEEIPKQIRFEQEIVGKREEIMGRISPGGITEAEAIAGTKELKVFTETKEEEYKLGYEKRAKEREEFAFKLKRPTEFSLSKKIKSKTPEFFDFDPISVEKSVFEKLDFGGEFGGSLAGFGAVGAVGALSFGKGAYEGIRMRPVKTAIGFAVVAGVTAATSGLGTAGALGTYGATALKVAKPLQYALGGVYGTSVIGRLALAEGGRVGKFEQAGEIFGTELLPMALGYKIGSYGGRRAGLYYERGQVLKGKSKLLPEGFKFDKAELAKIQKEYEISQAFKGTQPEVKELSFKGMERITPKQQDIIKSFLLSKKGKIVLGGTSGTRSQLLVQETIPPHDIDIFVKGFRQKVTASKYLSELGKQLNLKVKGGAVRGLGGEKIIEFKPFGEYLKPNIEQVAPWYRTSKAGRIKSPEGFDVLRLDFQAQQKLLGYARYGGPRTKDIIYYFTTAKPSLIKQAQIETVGSKVFDVKSPVSASSVPKDLVILGSTRIRGVTPEWIQIKSGLDPKVRQQVLTHELIHAKHPLWPESKVSGLIGDKEIKIAGFKGIKNMVSKVSYPSYPKALTGFYPGYAGYKSPLGGYYAPSKKDRIISTKYKPILESFKTVYPTTKGGYSPYPTTPKTTKGKYKPFEFELAPIVIDEPIIEPTKKKTFVFGDMNLGVGKKKDLLPKRKFQRTPSFGAVLKSEFRIEQPKLDVRLERTGLVERAFQAPKIIRPLGPFKI